jgi:hypothetical protein
MTVTIGSRVYSFIKLQPIGYNATKTEQGQTARTFTMAGILTDTEWTNMISDYNTWRTTRIAEPDSVASGSVGTTVSVSSTEGITISAVACWYLNPPSAVRLGGYWDAEITMIDATQQLQVLLTALGQSSRPEDSGLGVPNLGTLTLGSAVITLTQPPDTYRSTPALEMAASGQHALSGPLVAVQGREVEGWVSASGWTALLAWYASTVVAVPAAGSWFPAGAPTSTAENTIESGAKVVRYKVQVPLTRVV